MLSRRLFNRHPPVKSSNEVNGRDSDGHNLFKDFAAFCWHDQNNRVMLWLEIATVLLFVIDLVILLVGLK